MICEIPSDKYSDRGATFWDGICPMQIGIAGDINRGLTWGLGLKHLLKSSWRETNSPGTSEASMAARGRNADWMFSER